MDLEKEYYKLGEAQFQERLAELKNDEKTLVFFSNTAKPYYYFPSASTKEKLFGLQKAQWEYDRVFDRFSSFAQKKIAQSSLLDEIVHTNEIEQIYSTKHDIFSIIETGKQSGKEKIISTVMTYFLLLNENGIEIHSLDDVKKTHEGLLSSILSSENQIDGQYFRKGPVYISNGVKAVHEGLFGEENINKAMSEWLSLYNSKMDKFEKQLLGHFLFETIHPYYEGNGRLGRFLLSNGLLTEEKTNVAFLISKAISSQRSKYYKALEKARGIHQFGCVNIAVEKLAEILEEEIKKQTTILKEKLLLLSKTKSNAQLSKYGNKVYMLLQEADILTDFGISNEEIMKETGISKRNLIYIMNDFRAQGLLLDSKFGKTVFHKIKVNE